MNTYGGEGQQAARGDAVLAEQPLEQKMKELLSRLF